MYGNPVGLINKYGFRPNSYRSVQYVLQFSCVYPLPNLKNLHIWVKCSVPVLSLCMCMCACVHVSTLTLVLLVAIEAQAAAVTKGQSC